MKTVSLKLAKTLKQKGFPQDTYFHYQRSWHNKPYQFNLGGTFETADKNAHFAAPSADEIFDSLPELIHTPRLGGLTVSKYKDEYCIWYCNTDRESLFGPVMDISDKSLANAGAEMWLFLKEKGLL